MSGSSGVTAHNSHRMFRRATTSGLHRHFLNQPLHSSTKPLTTKAQPIQSEEKTGWTTIYRFPYIGIVSALNRTKWYQLGATALGCPLAYAMQMSGEVGPGATAICAVVGISATVATTLFSKLSAGTVGFFYLSQDEASARFGYVDSNGRRQDVICPTDQLQARGENRFFVRIAAAQEQETHHLKLFHSHGIILDVGKFNQIV